MYVEDCWNGAPGADQCLGDALLLVGLSEKPMGSPGVNIMLGGTASLASSKYNVTSTSCTTDPAATFQRTATGDVQTVYLDAEIQAVDMFREWDADQSGQINKEEFCKAVRTLGLHAKAGSSAAECALLFDSLDKDHSGTIE